MEKFRVLKLSEGMLSAMKAAGFSEPSEIQRKTIPLVIEGKDVIGGSATGSGKTLAFGAGIIEKVRRGGGIQALVITPTRELAEQVASTLRNFSKHLGLSVREVYGGVGIEYQIKVLRYADIVVGTPGRLLDHMQRRTLDLRRVKFLVLDEADRMLDMGFIRDVESIIRECPKERQTLLFSATISREITNIASKYMKSPVQVAVKNNIDASQLYQAYYDCESDEKFSLLVHLLRLEKNGVVMIFCNTRRNVDQLTKSLDKEGVRALAIHGGLSQNQRSNTLQAFHERDALILVCTDVAARGLDIKNVSHIYNFDIPTTSTEYTHRIGRTARAGKNGIAISFVSPGDREEFQSIFRDNPNLERLDDPKVNILPSANFDSNEDRKRMRSRHPGFRDRNQRGASPRRSGGRSAGRGSPGRGSHDRYSKHARSSGSRPHRR